jgi:hypothetical protein
MSDPSSPSPSAGPRSGPPSSGADPRDGQAQAGADWRAFADDVAADVRHFLTGLEGVAAGEARDEAVALLLLELSQIMFAGAKLGATKDVILESNWEPDVGEEPDVDALRARLAGQLGDIDEYVEVFDPYADDGAESYRLSDDIVDVAMDLAHGLRHYDAGRPLEALWWWQFSYLSHWGNHAGAALRALHAVVAHVRLDVADEDVEAQLAQAASRMIRSLG